MSTDALISAKDAIEEHLHKAVVFLDASWTFEGGPAFVAEGVIPGAIAFDIDLVRNTESPLPHMLPSPEVFSAHVESLGIGSDDELIVYDRISLFSAPRVWWMFKSMGHDRVKVLDGGLPAWIKAGGKVSGNHSRPSRRGNFRSNFRSEWLASKEDVCRAIQQEDATIIDARPAKRFTGESGEPRAGMRSGHMPGAINLPWSTLINANGTLDTDVRLPFSGPVITTCGSGVTASLLALALYRQGETPSVYDGSWAEWGSDTDTRVVTGS